MSIPTEPIGSVPRPQYLLDAVRAHAAGQIDAAALDAAYDHAVQETIREFEATGSPIVTDGEQAKSSFATYPLHGISNLAPDGAVIPFADGHTRQLPRLTDGPFRYGVRAGSFLARAKHYATRPLKQAVIAPSALSLLYPQSGLPGYAREQFIQDLVAEAVADIRSCLEGGAVSVQLDFTEGRLAVKLDPSRGLLRHFVDLNNAVLSRFDDAERRRIGIHTCPGGDHDSTHSADVDYGELLPELFRLEAGNFFIQLASEPDRARVLALIRAHARPSQRIFVGVTDPIDPRVETADDVAERVLEAARFIEPERLGTTDDCGFSPFADDVSTSRAIAFAKIAARVEGTDLAARRLGL
ncbi:MAG: cobalamin-independent methionine synthase II family protein [Vicinamibacterales bacterium]